MRNHCVYAMHDCHIATFLKRKTAIFAIAAFVLAAAQIAHAEPVYNMVEVIVTFVPGENAGEPTFANGALTVATPNKSAAIPALSIAIACESVVRDRNAPYFTYDGPWCITLFTSATADEILAELSAEPAIASAQLRYRDDLFASEGTHPWFPEATKNLFCPAQEQLHAPVLGESGLPGEPCALRQTDMDHDMDTPQAWAITRGDTNVVVAVIDSGFDLYHPNLGGPGPSSAVDDSLLYYNRGMWYRNWEEMPGDANHDGFPGVAGVDDDGDGLIDEDINGLQPENSPEADVRVGTWTGFGTGGVTIVDASANWSTNELQGLRFGLVTSPSSRYAAYEIIESNTATTITTQSSAFIHHLFPIGGWAAFTGSCPNYRICNGVDDDLDHLADDGPYDVYIPIPNDDDENGFEDDFRGWDFYNDPHIDPHECRREDYRVEDNDPRGIWDHGTTTASQIASADGSGQMMGVAPHVRVLPIRIGASYMCGSPGRHMADGAALERGIYYAIEEGVDVISLSISPEGLPLRAAQAAIDSGVIVVCSAGNEHLDLLPEARRDGVIYVAGVDKADRKCDYPDDANRPLVNYESNYGDWVDVSALGSGVTVAYWGVDPDVLTPDGTPVPWCPPDQWNTYGYDWGYPETHFAGGGFGTSLSAPIVAGIVALVKSAYPRWSPQEVVAKVIASADKIDDLNPDYAGQLGSGRVNAYKALTLYGNVAATGDTTWSHNIWIGGTIQVPAGHSLTIAAGDTVRVAIDDLLSVGPKEIEFAINGDLHINGTSGAPVVFQTIDDPHLTWQYNTTVNVTGSTFTIGGIAQIASTARSPLMAGVSTASQVFSVAVSAASALDSVKVDLSGLGVSGTTVRLYDNGQGEDLAASDGVYTSGVFAASLTAGGTYSAQVTAYVTGGGYTRRSVVVEVPQVVAKFTDVSSQTGLSYTGTPYSVTSGKFSSAYDGGMIVIPSDATAPAFDRVTVLPSGAPSFAPNGFSVALAGLRGVARADFDNDGDEDLFVAHAQTPKLYRNDAGTYVDVTSSMGLSSIAAGSASACWGDYDNDGWLDLFVTRCTLPGSEPPDIDNIGFAQCRLFRNTCGSGCGFVDVTSSAGLTPPYGTVGVAAAWGDIENDGDLDLVITDLGMLGYGNSNLLVNQGNGTFTEERASRFTSGEMGGYDINYGTGVVWADMNNDGYLDIVVSCASPGSRVLFNNGEGEFPGTDNVVFPSSADGYSGLQVLDHNLDGWQDVLLLSRTEGKPSRLFLAKPTVDGVEYVENTHNAGLAHTSKGMGSLAADFTGDGDMDLFVGRPVASGQFFYKTDDQSDANSLGQKYVKVVLVSPTADNVNRQGIGAAVTVTAGSLVQLQMVDGGSGRGGQRDRTLTYGLGDYSGPVTATVRWPGGTVQSDIGLIASGGGSSEFINVISDAAPVVSNVSVATLVVPGTTFFDWVFSWDTDVACKTANDVLTIDQVNIANPCWPGWTTVTPASGIPFVYEAKSGGGYRHKALINHEECNLNCIFRYTVTSDSGLHPTTSTTKSKKVTFCPSGF